MREFLFFGKKEKPFEPEQANKEGLVEKIGSVAKILALFAALNFPAALQAETGKDNESEKQEKLISDTKASLNKLMTLAKTDSRFNDGKIQGGSDLSKREYKEYQGEKMTAIVENGGAFTIVSQNLVVENGDKKTGVIFFDENSDGKLDRLVINEDESRNQIIDNIPYLFNSAEVINKLTQARVKSGLGQEKISTYTFDQDNKKVVRLAGFSGEKEDLSGEGAMRVIKIAQERYSVLIEELNQELEKTVESLGAGGEKSL